MSSVPVPRLYGILKVDILNIMGLSLVAAGWLWGRGRTRNGRVTAALAVTIGVLVLTPLLRLWSWPALVPDPIEWYLPAAARAQHLHAVSLERLRLRGTRPRRVARRRDG